MKSSLASTEVRTVFEVAHRYAVGAASIHELNGAVSSALAWANASGAAPQVHELLNDWSCMVNRRWNEWGLEKRPLSEQEFQSWLRAQLVAPAS